MASSLNRGNGKSRMKGPCQSHEVRNQHSSWVRSFTILTLLAFPTLLSSLVVHDVTAQKKNYEVFVCLFVLQKSGKGEGVWGMLHVRTRTRKLPRFTVLSRGSFLLTAVTANTIHPAHPRTTWKEGHMWMEWRACTGAINKYVNTYKQGRPLLRALKSVLQVFNTVRKVSWISRTWEQAETAFSALKASQGPSCPREPSSIFCLVRDTGYWAPKAC